MAGQAAGATAAAADSAGNANPFAMLLSLLGGGNGVEAGSANGEAAFSLTQLLSGQSNGAAGGPILAEDGSSLDLEEIDALLSDILSQLENGQPFDAAMLDQLTETGLIPPQLLAQLDSLIAALSEPGGATIVASGVSPATQNTDSGLPPAQPEGENIPGVTPALGTPGDGTPATSPSADAARQGTDQARNPQAPNATVVPDGANAPAGANGQASQEIAEQPAPIPASSSNQTPSRPIDTASAQDTAADATRPDIKPAIETERRRIGGDGPTGFLASLANGHDHAESASNMQSSARDALMALRAALQQRAGDASPTQAGSSAAPDMMLMPETTSRLQDFDLQMGGRTLDALTAGGAPKTVTVTSNGTQLPTHQLALTIATEARAGTRRFEIRLDPPEMGRIDIKLEMQADGTVRSMMTVERPETFDALNRDARQLERLLQQSGLKLDEGGLQLSMGGSGDDQQSFAGLFGDGGERQAMASGRITNEAAADDLTAENADLIANSAAQAAIGDGGVDIRV